MKNNRKRLLLTAIASIFLFLSLFNEQTKGQVQKHAQISPQATQGTCTGQYRAREPDDIQDNNGTVIDDTRYFDYFDYSLLSTPLMLYRHKPGWGGSTKYWFASEIWAGYRPDISNGEFDFSRSDLFSQFDQVKHTLTNTRDGNDNPNDLNVGYGVNQSFNDPGFVILDDYGHANTSANQPCCVFRADSRIIFYSGFKALSHPYSTARYPDRTDDMNGNLSNEKDAHQIVEYPQNGTDANAWLIPTTDWRSGYWKCFGSNDPADAVNFPTSNGGTNRLTICVKSNYTADFNQGDIISIQGLCNMPDDWITNKPLIYSSDLSYGNANANGFMKIHSVQIEHDTRNNWDVAEITVDDLNGNPVPARGFTISSGWVINYCKKGGNNYFSHNFPYLHAYTEDRFSNITWGDPDLSVDFENKTWTTDNGVTTVDPSTKWQQSNPSDNCPSNLTASSGQMFGNQTSSSITPGDGKTYATVDYNFQDNGDNRLALKMIDNDVLPSDIKCSNPWATTTDCTNPKLFRTGEVTTGDNFTFRYGRLEFTARLAEGLGEACSLWDFTIGPEGPGVSAWGNPYYTRKRTLSTDNGGDWNEIDLVEHNPLFFPHNWFNETDQNNYNEPFNFHANVGTNNPYYLGKVFSASANFDRTLLKFAGDLKTISYPPSNFMNTLLCNPGNSDPEVLMHCPAGIGLEASYIQHPCVNGSTAGNFADQYYTFAYEWIPGEIRFLVGPANDPTGLKEVGRTTKDVPTQCQRLIMSNYLSLRSCDPSGVVDDPNNPDGNGVNIKYPKLLVKNVKVFKFHQTVDGFDYADYDCSQKSRKDDDNSHKNSDPSQLPIAESSEPLINSLYPNPSNTFAMLKYNVGANNENIRIELLSVEGVVLNVLQNGPQDRGLHELTIPLNYAAGSYWVRVIGNGKIESRHLVVLK